MPRQTDPAPPPFIVRPTSTHTHTLILLHGLGSNGEKFGTELLATGKTSTGLTLPALFPGAKFIFPTSRRRRSSAFGRSVLTQWFDIARLEDPSFRKETQIQGLSESVGEILDIVKQERDLCGIVPRNIVLGGLSQGCATSLSVLLCLGNPIGGFVGMSGYLPFREDMDDAAADPVVDDDDPFAGDAACVSSEPAVRVATFIRDLLDLPAMAAPSSEVMARGTPVFLGHGSEDEKVPCSLGEGMAETVRRAGYDVTWRRYEGLGHWYKIPEEMDDIVDFLRSTAGWPVEGL